MEDPTLSSHAFTLTETLTLTLTLTLKHSLTRTCHAIHAMNTVCRVSKLLTLALVPILRPKDRA